MRNYIGVITIILQIMEIINTVSLITIKNEAVNELKTLSCDVIYSGYCEGDILATSKIINYNTLI